MNKMVEVTQEDANNYCRVLTALGMEEEGDPVAEIERLQKHAEHYRWLRVNGEPDEGFAYCADWSPEMYDAAIDAAMAESRSTN